MNEAQVRFSMGNYHQEEGEEEQALAWYLKAVESDPNLAEAHNNLGIIYKNRGEFHKAIAEYEKAVEILRGVYPERDSSVAEPVLSGEILRFAQNDIYLAQAYDNLGVIYAEMGLTEQAIATYEKALEADPQNPRAHNNLGIAYEEKADYKAATEKYVQALELCPELKEAHYNLGSIYGLMGKYEESIEELEKGRELDPYDAETRYNLILSYRNKGLRNFHGGNR